MRLSLLLLGSVGFATTLLFACGGSDGDGVADSGPSMATPSDASIDRARLAAPLRPDASCPVVIETPELVPAAHVTEGTEIAYESNPPSSGPHYPVWAHYQEFANPVPRPYSVHSLEHGGIVLSYKCDAPCPQVVEQLRAVRAQIATDPSCDAETRVRVVITPDPLLDVPVAAAAWGWTYKAQCVDAPTLTAFVRDHIAQGPENTCGAGRRAF